MQIDSNGTKQIVVRQIPIDLWRKLKAHAAIEGATLQDTVTKALEQYLKSA